MSLSTGWFVIVALRMADCIMSWISLLDNMQGIFIHEVKDGTVPEPVVFLLEIGKFQRLSV